MRSRVMPGSSPTIERRELVRRLKSVDLPTLGRPTMASTGHVDVSTGVSRRVIGGIAASGSGSSASMRGIGPCRCAMDCTGRLRILPSRAAALASAAAFAAAPRLTSARECWPRVAGVGRRAAFACAARLPPLECGLGFLALVPFRGFMKDALFQSFIYRPGHRIDLEFHCLVYRFHLRPAAAFAARLLLPRRHALALRAAL